jgi:GNAT superfamily N-acetyltransferase
MQQLRLTTDCSAVDWRALCELLQRAALGERDVEITQRVYTGSYLCVFAYLEDQMVGSARAISDGVTSSAIYDVVVEPELHGQGIGTQIMEFMLERLPKQSVMLVSVLRYQGFYRKLGFKRLVSAYMRKASFDAWLEGGYFDESVT